MLTRQNSFKGRERIQTLKLSRGHVAFASRDPLEQFASVASGVVKLIRSRPDGRQQIVGLLFPGDCFFSSSAENERGFAEAASDAEICSIPRNDFELLLVQLPELQREILRHIVRDLDGARDWMFLLGRKTAEERVASFLLWISSHLLPTDDPRIPDRQRGKLTLPLTRIEIADFLGLTYETVSRQLSVLKERGIVEFFENRDARLLDVQALKKMSGDALL